MLTRRAQPWWPCIPEGGLVPVALEVFGTMGKLGEEHIRQVLQQHVHVRRVEWADGPNGKPKMIDHGNRYATFVRRLREHLAVALQLGNADLVAEWYRRLKPLNVPAAGHGAGALVLAGPGAGDGAGG